MRTSPPAREPRYPQVETVCALLKRPEVRLITLTGDAEDGKSRLATAVAAVVQPRLLHGAVVVDLATSRQQSGIAQAIAESLRIQHDAPASLLDELALWLRNKHMLLVLDHVQRLRDAGQFIARLLDECPRLQVLLTSALRMRIAGEQRVALQQIAAPLVEQPVRQEPAWWCLLPGTAVAHQLHPLTGREVEVAQLVALGFSNKQIADELVITCRTAETHACRILRKLSLACRNLVVIWALERGLVVVVPRHR